jgi:uncharacterized membrane protein
MIWKMKLPQLSSACLCLLLCAVVGDLWLLVPALLERPVAGCGGASGCAAVLASPWAYWLGVPVSLPALAVHLAAVLLLGFTGSSRLTRRALAIIFFAVLGASLWFLGIQVLVLGKYCVFCLTVHALGFLSALLWLTAESQWRDSRALGAALAGLVVFGGGQVLWPTDLVAVKRATPSVAVVGQPTDFMALAGDVAAADIPVLGDPAAPRMACLLFDFTCLNCRKSHHLAEAWVAGQGGRVALALFPVALCPDCNRYVANTLPEHKDACQYARLALALWRFDPAVFRRFCQAFLGPEPTAPPVNKAQDWAAAQVGGAEMLRQLLEQPELNRRLATNADFFAACVRATERLDMPKLVTSRAITSGTPDGARGYAPYLEEAVAGR